ncbi:hypothetical protein ACGFYY_38270 [Streptomyces sp. NPDC048331]|uniref:hypothetical protein n=1 Tax=Streptomyces sp. NPDC048331 TaxID=3365534 RepID=UPI0037157955
MGIAFAIDAAGRHMSPETVAELDRLQTRVAELETSARGCDGEGCVLPHSSWCTRARKFASQHDGCTCGEPWTDTPQTHAGHCWLMSPPWDEMEWHRKRVAELLARVAELEAERHATNEALSDAAVQLRADRNRFAELEAERTRPAPMLYRDRFGDTWQADGNSLTLAATEAGGPTTGRPWVEPAADVARDFGPLVPVRSPEDPYVSPLHHDYRVSHDLPEVPHV